MATEVLVKELNDGDINWMLEIGQKQQLASGDILFQEQSEIDALYVILSGTLAAAIASSKKSALGRAFAELEGDQELEQEIDRYTTGEVLGEIAFLKMGPSVTRVEAAERTVVLAVPHEKLLAKIKQDIGFAARFYRAIAILMLDRFEKLIKQYSRRKNLQIQPLHDGPLTFGELSDSDVDWLSENGLVEKVPADTILIRGGRPAENLYVLLEGSLSVAISEDKRNTLTRVFALLETSDQNTPSEEIPEREFARSSRGEMLGQTALLDSRLSSFTFKALEDSLVLAIPRQKLLIKLQQDPGMSARFYRVIGMLVAERLQGLISRLGYGKSSYQQGQKLSLDSEYEDEINLDVMDNITLGGARFDWMLRRLKARRII